MSCASKYGLDVLGTFSSFPAQREMLSKPLCSINSTAFFLFWVRLWVKRRQELGSKDKGLTDYTSVGKEISKHFLDKFWLFIAVFTPFYLLSGTL